MHNRPNPTLNETAAGLVSDSLWVLLERHGMLGLPLAHCSRDSSGDDIRVDLASGHIVYIMVSPEPGRSRKYRPRHRR